jgi:ABC-type Fe3+/spermidine/putrescine transport system ATPase subunit
LRTIIKRVGLTALYVTHDQHEAFAISDRMALMNAGRFEQVDAPAEIYRRPATVFAARFLGLNNIVPVEKLSGNQAQTALGAFELAGISDTAAALLLHPDGITPAENGDIAGTMSESVFLGDAYRVTLQTAAGLPLTFKLAARSHSAPAPGETYRVSVAPEYIIPLKN